MASTNYSLFIGKSKPEEAPSEALRTLVSIDVSADVDNGIGFQLMFRLKQAQHSEFDLLRSRVFEPFNRCRLSLTVAGQPVVLFDGVITHLEAVVSQQPGSTDLQVMGRDLTVMLDLEEKRAIFKNLKDSSVARQVLGGYSDLQLQSQVIETRDSADSTDLSTHQLGTDLAFLRELASRNGYIFLIESSASGPRAYFGPESRTDLGLPTLTCNAGAATNVKSLRATYNAFQPGAAAVDYSDAKTGRPVLYRKVASSRAALAAKPEDPQRVLLETSTVIDSSERASVAAQAVVDSLANAVTLDGVLDTQDYGAILRPNYVVGVRGLGNTFDGKYYVRRVQYHFEKMNSTQSFTLSRESTGSTVTRFS